MIKQPLENRNSTKGALASEKRNIDLLNEVLGDIELTKREEDSLIWLCGWETYVLRDIISAFKKAEKKKEA